MKRFLSVFILTVLSCLMLSVNVCAEVNKQSNLKKVSTETQESILLPADIKTSTGYGNNAKGTYISTSLLSISNKGYGEIGIYASTLAHKPVKKIRMNVYLDRWDEIKETWYQVDYFYFTYEHKEGEEDLTEVTEDFSVLGLPTGCYYRLRSFNAVFPFEGGVESQGPVTDGVLITNGPAV